MKWQGSSIDRQRKKKKRRLINRVIDLEMINCVENSDENLSERISIISKTYIFSCFLACIYFEKKKNNKSIDLFLSKQNSNS